MLPIRSCRPLLTRRVLRLEVLPIKVGLRFRTQTKAQKRAKREALQLQKSIHPTSREDERKQITKAQLDTPEQTQLKTILSDEVFQERFTYNSIDGSMKAWQALVESNSKVPTKVSSQVVNAFCQAYVDCNRRLQRGGLEPGIQQSIAEKRAQLSWLIDNFFELYQQGFVNADSDVPANLLFHYASIGDGEKGLRLWDWLSRNAAREHMSYRAYAARIVLADTLNHGADVCEDLFEEALLKLGSPLVRYHLSNNAVLADADGPAPPEAVAAIPLLRAIFPIRLANKDWKNAYLGLDTILRLDPTRLWKPAKYDVLKYRSAWEASLLDNLETFLQGDNRSERGAVTQVWLSELLRQSTSQSPGLDVEHATPARIASIAFTILRYLATRLNHPGLSMARGLASVSELEILWTCCARLQRWAGKSYQSMAENETPYIQSIAALVTELLSLQGSELDKRSREHSRSLSHRIANNLKLFAKIDGHETLRAGSTAILRDLAERCQDIISYLQRDDSEDGAPLVDTKVPEWSTMLSTADMHALYDELGHVESTDVVASDIPKSMPEEVTQEEADGNVIEDADTQALIYETKTGTPFAKARFHSWSIINEMLLAAEIVPRHDEDSLYKESAAQQALALEDLNATTGSKAGDAAKRQNLLAKLRLLRLHRGDTSG